MTTTALIIRDDARLVTTYTEHALAMRDEALATAALIGKVTNELENNEAAAAMVAIRTVKKQCEEARKAAKEPVLDFGRRIDAAAKEFVAELDKEEIRLAKIVGDFQTAQLARQRAAEAAANAELQRIEREREAALAQAQDHDEREAIIERANQEAEAARPAIEVVKAKGQVVREVWEIESVDEWQLASAHPELVKEIRFDTRKLHAALDILGKLPGVKAKRVVDVSARVGKQPLAITV